MTPATKGTATATGIAGAIVVIAAWTLHQYAHVEIPAEVAGAAGTLIAAAIAPLIHGASNEARIVA